MNQAEQVLSSPLEIQNKLKMVSGKEVLLMLTNNTQTMVTIKESPKGSISLRAHKMFLHADEEIITALGQWIGGKRGARERVKQYIAANSALHIDQRIIQRKVSINPAGKYYNLDKMAKEINEKYLGGRSSAPVTWGRKVTKRKPSTIRLGWYDPTRRLITLSQRLDRRDIPRYMVEYVLFHEMLHEVIGVETKSSGRRDIHSKKFNLMEQTYPFYYDALKFEKKKWGGV